MQKLQIFVYNSSSGLRLGLVRNSSHLPALGVERGQAVSLLTPPLNSSQAYQLLEVWSKRLRGPAGKLRWHFLRRGRSELQPPCVCSDSEPVMEVLGRIEEILRGRIISEFRLMKHLRDEGFWPSEISRALDVGVFQERLVQLPGFTAAPWGEKVCTRCGSREVRAMPCLNCGSLDCLRCLECSSMGEHRECSILLAVPGQVSGTGEQPVGFVLDYELTQAQREASLELLDFWDKRQGRALVWAACGAGKTEVSFSLIEKALAEGYEVLFAIPRQDLVREIAQRLHQSFPAVEIAVHHGGQPWLGAGRLVVATTHQVLHFYKRFELAILDEVDAFPFQGSEMLRFGLHRSLTPTGQLVEMTATPSACRPSRVITIPARYHGYPLPEPILFVEKLPPWSALEAAALPAVIADTLTASDNRWLVFAPTIACCTVLQKALAAVIPRKVGLCHSKLEGRTKVIEDFRQGRLDILVSTSVLERGVNFPGVEVLVVYADHSLFTANALVQMAGRVGRTADSPTGKVLFVASKIAPSMKQALALIRELNDEARQRGLLNGESTA